MDARGSRGERGRERTEERRRNTREPRGTPPLPPPPRPLRARRFEGRGVTHRESTYAHLALLLHQSTALHHVGFSVSGGRVEGTSPQKCRADVKAASASARRRVHIDAHGTRTHYHAPTRTAAGPWSCDSLLSGAAGETHLRIGNSRWLLRSALLSSRLTSPRLAKRNGTRDHWTALLAGTTWWGPTAGSPFLFLLLRPAAEHI